MALARRLGFPDVILPTDVRNDLYLTLLGGEFTRGNKVQDRNVEVTVKVCNRDGSVRQVRRAGVTGFLWRAVARCVVRTLDGDGQGCRALEQIQNVNRCLQLLLRNVL